MLAVRLAEPRVTMDLLDEFALSEGGFAASEAGAVQSLAQQ
jgi:hypothetical protein